MSSNCIIVYIDGVDRCGKTTLAKQLSQDTGLPVAHFGVPPERDTYKWYLFKFRDMVALNPHGFILDRFIISNLVYNGRFGGGVLSKQEFNDLAYEMAFHQVRALVVMRSEPVQIAKRLHEESEVERAGMLSVREITDMQDKYLELSYLVGRKFCSVADLRDFFDLSYVSPGEIEDFKPAYYELYGKIALALKRNGGLRIGSTS